MPPSETQRRHLSDDALLVHIKAVHVQSRGGYGWPRVWKELLARSIRVGKKRFKVTTDSNHALPISPNLLNREFTMSEPDRVWAGDVTYIATDEGRLFWPL
ncbi:transposase InsO family protein [Paucibacter oligotrophus]|uniref:Transposase InsO family protein n=1 Tax=Roseateles oligotrophus TaxID=1769250 RepID=A0A840L4C3_9BURK|nr:transposase InsO family protein [Roseateles oligotrophus]